MHYDRRRVCNLVKQKRFVKPASNAKDKFERMIYMKKLITLILTLFTIFTTAHASDEISVFIEGQRVEFDQPPVIIDGRTLVPMRALFEALGADVHWYGETKTVQGISRGVSVEVTIDKAFMLRNTCAVDLDVPARIINGRTMIPLRVVSEAFGMQVIWDNQSRTINLSSLGNIKELHWNDDYVYFGETLEGEAYGYGILYKKQTDEIAEMGLYDSLKSPYIIKGTLWKDDGTIYCGGFSAEGKYDDYGIWTLSNGNVYYGNFENGYPTIGTLKYTNGSELIASFEDFKPVHGQLYINDIMIYNGGFKDNKPHGLGEYYYTNGAIYYNGEWSNGTWEGNGIVYYENGNVLWKGSVSNGLFSGWGELYDENGKYLGYYQGSDICETGLFDSYMLDTVLSL